MNTGHHYRIKGNQVGKATLYRVSAEGDMNVIGSENIIYQDVRLIAEKLASREKVRLQDDVRNPSPGCIGREGCSWLGLLIPSVSN